MSTEQGPAAGFTEHVSRVAAERAAAWEAFAEVLAHPTPELAERLRSGELTEAWRTGVRWLGADVEMFTAALMSLDVYVRGAERRSVSDDVATLAADHAEHVAGAVELRPTMLRVAQLCRSESQAWADGDMPAGKELRAQQQTVVSEQLTPALPELGGALAQRARSNVWRTLGRLLLAFLSAESGKDYQRAILGESRARHRPSGA